MSGQVDLLQWGKFRSLFCLSPRQHIGADIGQTSAANRIGNGAAAAVSSTFRDGSARPGGAFLSAGVSQFTHGGSIRTHVGIHDKEFSAAIRSRNPNFAALRAVAAPLEPLFQ